MPWGLPLYRAPIFSVKLDARATTTVSLLTTVCATMVTSVPRHPLASLVPIAQIADTVTALSTKIARPLISVVVHVPCMAIADEMSLDVGALVMTATGGGLAVCNKHTISPATQRFMRFSYLCWYRGVLPGQFCCLEDASAAMVLV